jgi:hypothetical protein
VDLGGEAGTLQFGRQGFGALTAFALGADHGTRNALVHSLRLITSAVSLGHDEALIVYEDTPAGRAAMFPRCSAPTACCAWQWHSKTPITSSRTWPPPWTWRCPLPDCDGIRGRPPSDRS